MKKYFWHFYRRLNEQLWFKPFIFCVLSVFAALLAHETDGTFLDDLVPNIKTKSIEGLLDTISASMLVISIFAVTSMISAFSAATNTATPRSFKVVVTDDVSQYALSTFIGSFIFSIVASVALDNEYYGKSGKFILFLFTLLLFALVILTFLRWVDRISRLGRLEHTIHQVEKVAARSLSKHIECPFLNAHPIKDSLSNKEVIKGEEIGYVQHIDVEKLQNIAEENDIQIQLNCLPGNFIHQNTEIAFCSPAKDMGHEELTKKINHAIKVGDTRMYADDPRFGFVALAEIASRALSPGINDPGTAIQIIGSQERLFYLWNNIDKHRKENKVTCDRVQVPAIELNEFLDDAFRPISRYGASNIEVMIRLQRAYDSISQIEHKDLNKSAKKASEEAYKRAEESIVFESDLELLKVESLYKQ
ncbi:MAG: DUF2254 domain-containing protein [Flavobacteriaceae bacterium]|nr:DUF2254 domain-containing protein [Flavobacteriaceae bacterium]